MFVSAKWGDAGLGQMWRLSPSPSEATLVLAKCVDVRLCQVRRRSPWPNVSMFVSAKWGNARLGQIWRLSPSPSETIFVPAKWGDARPGQMWRFLSSPNVSIFVSLEWRDIYIAKLRQRSSQTKWGHVHLAKCVDICIAWVRRSLCCQSEAMFVSAVFEATFV